MKNNAFSRRCVLKKHEFFLEAFALIRARAGPIRAHMGPYGPEKFQEIRNKIRLIGAFKVLCTLP